MDFDIFENHVKDALTNLFDVAALENHILIETGISPAQGYTKSKGEYLRQVLLEGINQLKPVGIEYDLLSPEWRSYVILSERYVENNSSYELTKKLHLGERQIRRGQKKAIRLVAQYLWEKIQQQDEIKTQDSSQGEFTINRELINLNQIISGVINLLKSRLEQEQVTINFIEPPQINPVNSDRIILRQILIGTLNLLLQKENIHQIQISIQETDLSTELTIHIKEFNQKHESLFKHLQEQESLVAEWIKVLNLEINEYQNPDGFHFSIGFPKQEKKLVMIVDDQEPALRMYQRYLSKTNYKIFGLSKATKVLSKAIELEPAIILLDIMMPKIDGWEVLQSLRLNDKTKHIPIIICSAWGEPELAKSLGANHFLRKPIVQRELLEILENFLD